MNFRPELAAKVMAGEKTVTRRLVSENPNSPWYVRSCKLKVGRDYAVCPGRGKHSIGRVRVTYVNGPWPLGHLTEESARAEGFEDADGFEAGFRAINGAYDPGALAWIIGFESIA